MTIRQLYLQNGVLMIVIGFAFWGYHVPLAPYLGIDVSGPFMAKFELHKAVSLGGLYGGALMAFGLASLAISRATDDTLPRAAAGYFLAAHGFLAFITFAKQVAIWETTLGALLLTATLLPATGFLWVVLATSAPVSARLSNREQRIRDAAGQAERTRLAQDLHDSVKQQIYSVQTNLAAAETRWTTDQTGALDAIAHARSAARDAMSEMVALLDRLRQDPIEGVGLVEAIRRQSEALAHQTDAEVTTHFGAMPGPDQLAPGAATTLFRIAQEALANVARHARPRHVHVEAGVESTGARLILRVKDDGRGFRTERASTGMGIANMRERARELDAAIEITSVEGEGSTVAVGVPLLDAVAARRTYHQRALFAAALPAAVMSLCAFVWPGVRIVVGPLIAIYVAVLCIHAQSLIQLRRS